MIDLRLVVFFDKTPGTMFRGFFSVLPKFGRGFRIFSVPKKS